MTDRRRNLLVLLLVAGLLAASLAVIFVEADAPGARPQGRRLADLPGQAHEAGAGHGESIDRAIDIMRKRVDQLGVAEPEIQRSGAGPDRRLAPRRQERRRGPQAGRHDRAALLLRLGEERPRAGLQAGADRPERHGRPARRARPSAGQPQYDAVKRAERLQAARTTAERDDEGQLLPRRRQDQEGARRARGGPGRAARGQPRQAPEGRAAAPHRVTCPQGTVVVRAEKADAKSAAPNASTSCATTPSLSGKDIKNPEQNFDNGAGGTGRRTSRSSSATGAAKAWQDTTREIAQRGQEPVLRRRPAVRVPALRDRPRRRAHLGAVHRLQPEPRRHRRAAGLGDLRRLHDRLRAARWPTS